MKSLRAAQDNRISGYRGSRSPVGLGGTVAVHALVVGAFLLIPREVIERIGDRPFITYAVPDTPPPPPEPLTPAPESKAQPLPRARRPVAPDPAVTLPEDSGGLTARPGPVADSGSGTGTIPIPDIEPVPEPVLVDAAIDPRALPAFQPDYPGAMIRQGLEGKVTVRVFIGADGRVTDIEKLSASNEAFWIATRNHALRKWRFRPATRDRVPVGSSKVLTVHFTLTDR